MAKGLGECGGPGGSPPAGATGRRVGVAVKAIQAMLRHSSLAITADTYTSLFADDGHAAAEQVASVVPRAVAAGEVSETPGRSRSPDKVTDGPLPDVSVRSRTVLVSNLSMC
jgi:hypothetical protein